MMGLRVRHALNMSNGSNVNTMSFRT